MKVKTVSTVWCTFLAAVSLAANYPRGVATTEPNTWSQSYSGVLAAAQQTGYPVLLIVVNSATCGHCHLMIENTVNTAEFAQMEKDLTYYEVILDAAAGASEFMTAVNTYSRYFDNGMYPLVAVLRKDGRVYGSFSNNTTDTRGVALDLRQLIESLAQEQGADIWSKSGVAPFSVTAPIAAKDSPTALTWAAKLKGRINGVLFDGNQNICGTFIVNLTARGTATVRFTTYSGREMVRGSLSLNGDVPQLSTGSLLLSYNTSANVWYGSWNGYSAYASSLSSASYSGLYTSAATNVTGSGYATLAIKNGKGKIDGVVGGKNKISARDVAVVLPKAIMPAELVEKWSAESDMVFVPMIKAGKFYGGAAVSNGKASFSIFAFGKEWGGIGSAWDVNTNLSVLNGKVLRLMIDTHVFEVPIRSLNGKKVVAGDNEIAARISAMVRKGTFKGSVKISGARYGFDGAILAAGGSISGIGVTYGAGIYRVEIGDAR